MWAGVSNAVCKLDEVCTLGRFRVQSSRCCLVRKRESKQRYNNTCHSMYSNNTGFVPRVTGTGGFRQFKSRDSNVIEGTWELRGLAAPKTRLSTPQFGGASPARLVGWCPRICPSSSVTGSTQAAAQRGHRPGGLLGRAPELAGQPGDKRRRAYIPGTALLSGLYLSFGPGS